MTERGGNRAGTRVMQCIIGVDRDEVVQSPPARVPIRCERIGTWRERLWLANGRELLLRPIVPADADALRRSFARLSPEEIRLRFLHPITEMTAAFARQLCELDRASAFALVVTEPLPAGEALIGAVARLALDREQRKAEFALIVGREIAGQGVGTLLLKRLIDCARRRRMDEVWGDVREENSAMLLVCDELGFNRSHASDEPGVVHIRKRLRSV